MSINSMFAPCIRKKWTVAPSSLAVWVNSNPFASKDWMSCSAPCCQQMTMRSRNGDLAFSIMSFNVGNS